MKKKREAQLTAQEATVDVVDNSAGEGADKPDKKKTSKLKQLSILWTVIMLCVYIVLDAIKIVKNGWTAINIIVTVFLALQVLLFVVFTIIGAKDKQQSNTQKTAMKYVKKTKKITLKLMTLITSVMMIIGVESVTFNDVLAVTVATISLLLMIISLIISIRKQARKAGKTRQKQQKLQAKQEKRNKD